MNAEIKQLEIEYANYPYHYLVHLAREEYGIEDSNTYTQRDLIDKLIAIEYENCTKWLSHSLSQRLKRLRIVASVTPRSLEPIL